MTFQWPSLRFSHTVHPCNEERMKHKTKPTAVDETTASTPSQILLKSQILNFTQHFTVM